jgi:hypothetical protein
MLDSRYSMLDSRCWRGEAYFVKREANWGEAGRDVRDFPGEGKLLTTAGRAVSVDDNSAEEAWKMYDL